MRDRKRVVRSCITEGADVKRVLRPFDSEFRAPHPCENECTKTECNDIRITDRQGLVKELDRCGDIMLVEPDYKSRHCQRRRIIATARYRRVRMLNSSLAILLVQPSASKSFMIRKGKTGVRTGVARFKRQCLFKQRNSLCCGLGRSVSNRLSTQQEIIGVEIIWSLAFDALNFNCSKLRFNCPDHAHS